jgi:flagellar basal body-associated protein FliL
MDWTIVVVVIVVLVAAYVAYAWFQGKWPFGSSAP